jgi:hypothetical protein
LELVAARLETPAKRFARAWPRPRDHTAAIRDLQTVGVRLTHAYQKLEILPRKELPEVLTVSTAMGG